MAAVLKEEDFVEARIARIESDVAHMRTDISELKADFRDLKGEMGELKKDVGDLKVGLTGLRGDMNALGEKLSGRIDKAILETRIWMLSGAMAALLALLSHAFHWLGL
jgi:archaellum component FlaC